MNNLISFSGTVTSINDITHQMNDNVGCYKIMSINDGSVNFMVSPDTYFVDQEMVMVGDYITGYYDSNAPVALIYPPQYLALIVVRYNHNQNVKIDYFDSQLISSDGRLKLNIEPPYTQTILKNGQLFTGNPANRILIVLYGPSSRSIPALTTPFKIIVWC